MVIAAGLDALAEQPVQPTTRGDLGGVRCKGRISHPMAAVAEDVGQMLMQGSAEGDVDHLRAAADAEHRYPAVQGSSQQSELPLVAFVGGLLGRRVRLLAVGGRVDVLAAGEDQTVEPTDHLLGDRTVDGLWRQQHGDAAGPGDALEVDGGQEAGGNVPHPAARLLPIRGESDDRRCHRAARNAQSRGPSPSR